MCMAVKTGSQKSKGKWKKQSTITAICETDEVFKL